MKKQINFDTNCMLQSSTASYKARAKYKVFDSSFILAFAIVDVVVVVVQKTTAMDLTFKTHIWNRNPILEQIQ